MIREGSLSLRLLAAWLVFLLLTLPMAALGLQALFERSIDRGAISDLTTDLNLIADSIEIDPSGNVNLVDVPAHPNFLLAYGHRYWQLSEDGKPLLRSPSLWAETLSPTQPSQFGALTVSRFSGPNDQSLLGLAEIVRAPSHNDRAFEIVTAIDYEEILVARHSFSNDVWIGVAVVFLLIILAAMAQVFIGLKPLKALRESLTAVRNGSARRIEGNFPTEIAPLISETNDLLAARDDALAAASARAANLAHGLKTPLAVMAALSRQLRRDGAFKPAMEFEKQLEAMRWHVERELALSRPRFFEPAAHSQIDAATEISGIVSALKKLARSEELNWNVSINPSLPLTIDRADFSDIMGNVLDNAQKWARHQVLVEASQTANSILLTVDDDGPGVEDEQIDRIVQRGERADPTVPGSGLGLAIASELIFLYGGQLRLSRSSLGGLRAAITLNQA
ncbi:ATP-binding protein [Hyphomicrobium sp. 99]|uniref:ATP-binding protein n=1 Tax=Hyphomicrobium sp. 99 TaxID=1163419 RepID=UPI0005F7C156|nr:ATP-binding protein [Hyphomicrobium sp. 99]